MRTLPAPSPNMTPDSISLLGACGMQAEHVVTLQYSVALFIGDMKGFSTIDAKAACAIGSAQEGATSMLQARHSLHSELCYRNSTTRT